MKLTPEYLVRINYKSGIQEEFWVSNFSIKGGTWTWRAALAAGKKPVVMSIDNVESVWQLKIRYRFRLRSNTDE